MKKAMLLLSVLAVIAAGCSSAADDPELVGIRASSDPAVGDARFLFAVSQIDGVRRGGPDEAVSIVATSLDAPEVSLETDAIFEWVVPDGFGLYRAELPFDRAGLWEIDFTVSTGEITQPFLVDVQAEPTTVSVGDAAPILDTPTIPDTPIEDLTTDGDPLLTLYDTSLGEAIGNGRQTVVIFATPAYCTSAACGPLLQQTKDASATYPDVDFVHIEVYEGFNEPDFAPDTDHLVPAVVAFNLPSEPWIFVMDEDGMIIARFEGVLGEGELESVLES